MLRPLRLMNGNLAAIWPFHAIVTGNPKSPWGDQPVRLLPGTSGQPYAFQFHASEQPQSIGHYLVVAPSGGGKTTLMMHLLAGLTKFPNVRSYIFDSREGARFMVEALGGHYQSFEKLALNPLDVDDTQANRHRISLILKSILGEQAGEDDVGRIIDQILSTTFATQRKHRTLNDIFPLAFPKGSESRKVFRPWVTDPSGREGIYSHIFNAPTDTLREVLGKAQITGINMNQALADPTLGATFRKAAVEMFREYRKLNGIVGMAFQDPAALHASGVAEAIIDNTCTLILFPNPLAMADEYAPFNLNEEHLAFLTDRHEGRKVLIVRRDGPSGLDETVVLDIDLAWLGTATRFYRSGIDAVRELAEAQANHPDDWQGRL